MNMLLKLICVSAVKRYVKPLKEMRANLNLNSNHHSERKTVEFFSRYNDVLSVVKYEISRIPKHQ